MKNSSNNANSKTDSNIDWSIYKTNEIELDSSLVITKEGIYVLSETLENGSIEVNSKGNIKIILDNVNITNKNGPAINVKNAKNIVISTKEDNINNLTDDEVFSGYDDSINATIYSKDNLILEGDGTLIVNSNNKNAIVSCNNLIINDETYKINASIDALKGKDSVIIKNGNFEIKSNDDGIHADNELLIDNGTINIVRTYEGWKQKK